MHNRTFDSRGHSDDPNVSDAKIQGGCTGGGALTVFYGNYTDQAVYMYSMRKKKLSIPSEINAV